jgi:hypothetical protein
LEELEETFGIPSPLRTELREEAEIAGAIGILITKFKGRSFTSGNAQKILDEEDAKYVGIVIKEMKRLKIIMEKDNQFNFL